MYMASFNSTIARYRELLSEQGANRLKLPNANLDVGIATAEGKYTLTDAAYSDLLHKLKDHYSEIPQELRSDILAFYHAPVAPAPTKKGGEEWTQTLKELGELQSVDTDLRRPLATDAGAPLPR
jgi:hypothetical protein